MSRGRSILHVYKYQSPQYLFVDVEVAFVYVVNLYCACKNKNNKFKKNNMEKFSRDRTLFYTRVLTFTFSYVSYDVSYMI